MHGDPLCKAEVHIPTQPRIVDGQSWMLMDGCSRVRPDRGLLPMLPPGGEKGYLAK